MKESAERIVRLGLKRKPKAVFDDVDSVTAAMIRDGWRLTDSIMEESLGNIHLLFERDIEAPES